MSSQPHPTALARHQQTPANVGLSFEELTALAGKWDRYPAHIATAHACPVCGKPLAPLTVYCDRACMLEGQRRAYRDGAKRRQPDEIATYSFPPPRKGE